MASQGVTVQDKIPETITQPHLFKESPSCGFDGVLDWYWTEGCFGNPKITPTDFDGVVERKGNFLILESKNPGVSVPPGQMIAFQRAYELGCFSILFIEGKLHPQKVKVWAQPGLGQGKQMTEFVATNAEKMKAICHRWYEFADTHPKTRIETFDEVVTNLKMEKAQLATKLAIAKHALLVALEEIEKNEEQSVC